MNKKYFFSLITITLVLIPLATALAGDEYKFAWDKKIDGNVANDQISDLAFDNNSGIFVAGFGSNLVSASSLQDWWIKRFWLNGSEDFTWNKTFNGNLSTDIANSVLIDNNSGVFVFGYGSDIVSSSSGPDWWVKRFWLNGSEDFTWNKTFDGGSIDIISFSGIDNNSGVFFGGYGTNLVSGTSGRDWWIKRFWLNGSEDFTWNKTFNGAGSNDVVGTVAFDNNSGVFFGGYGTNLVSGTSGQDWWIKRFWLNGSEDLSWNKTFNGAGTGADQIISSMVDNQSGIFFSGFGTNLVSGSSGADWWVKRFWLNGSEDFTWNKTFDGSSSTDILNNVGFDNSYGVFFVGFGTNLVSGSSGADWWVKRFWLNGSEDFTWNKTFDGSSSSDLVGSLVFDNFGNVFFGGYGTNIVSASSGQDWWIKKFQGTQTGIACYFIANATCPTGTVKLIGLRNDTGGYSNAHAEINSLTNYNYSVCCNETDSSRSIGNACDEATVIKLNQTTNSHVEIGSGSAYSNLACLNSTYKKISCTYNNYGFCPDTYQCILSMASSEGDNSTNAHVSNCYYYSETVCCKEDNSPPSQPILTYPINGNATVFERKINFTWDASTDPEGDAITYNLNVSCGPGCSCSDIYQTGIPSVNYTPSNILCKDVLYNWTVTACDVYGDCNVSAKSNFTILSVVDFVLIVNATSFGQMAQDENNDTSDNTPNSIVGRNNGNVLLNSSINASTLFVSVPLNRDNFMFKVADNETGSINTSCSQISYTNFTGPHKNFFCNLSYFDTNDEIRLDINITIPSTESSGNKFSNIEIAVVSSE